MFICEISIIILICLKLGSVGPEQQKIKLSSPNNFPIEQSESKVGHKQLVFSYGLFCNNADVRNRRQKKRFL